MVWASAWYLWFRDSPAEKGSLPSGEEVVSEEPRAPHEKFPLRVAFRSPSIRAMLITAFCYVYVYNFFQTWFHTFLVKGRGFSEAGLFFRFFRT